MSYPSAMPMKASTEAPSKTTSGYRSDLHTSATSPKYPLKWTVFGLVASCSLFWAAFAWLV